MTVSLLKQLGRDGRFPPMAVQVQRLGADSYTLDRLENYQFSSNILIPVDSFSFSFHVPDNLTGKDRQSIAPGTSALTIDDMIQEGDVVVLSFNDVPVCTGLVGPIEMGTDENGDVANVMGRDLMSQLEDNDAVSVDMRPLYGEPMKIAEAIGKLVQGTRISPTNFIDNGVPDRAIMLASEPGESRLTVLQRFLEPLNCVAWMSPQGNLTVGRPSFDAGVSGEIFSIKSERRQNCRSIKVVRNAVAVPTRIVGLWAGGDVAADLTKVVDFDNPSPSSSRLKRLGHNVNKMVVVSTPSPHSADGKADLARFGGDNGFVGSYVKREIARQNVGAFGVQVVMPGHYDETGTPFLVDTTWRIRYEKGNVDEVMYCYGVDYTLSEEAGQNTTLSFCRLNTIVAEGKAP